MLSLSLSVPLSASLLFVVIRFVVVATLAYGWMSAANEFGPQQHILLTVRETFGPLFILREQNAKESIPSTEKVAAALHAQWPQFHKKQHGWKLSIEELEYLVWYCAEAQSNEPKDEGARHSLFVFSISVESGDAAQLRSSLAAQNARSCAIYRLLTYNDRLQLRHGSMFGALFIGYRDLQSHGDILFFLGPLSPLEEVRAARVASSVGKSAEVVFLEQEGTKLVRRPIPTTLPFVSGCSPRKRRRQGG